MLKNFEDYGIGGNGISADPGLSISYPFFRLTFLEAIAQNFQSYSNVDVKTLTVTIVILKYHYKNIFLNPLRYIL